MGRSCVVLEAAPRVGGRAYTESAKMGAPFDHGATWLHEAGANPLTPHAPSAIDHDTVRERCLWLGDRWATPEELREQNGALDAFETQVFDAFADGQRDRAVSEVAPKGGRWDATIAHWLGAQINASSLAEISLEDFVKTDLSGPNLLPREGVGGVVARLATGLPILTNARIERIRWDGPGVTLEGGFGTLRARSAIVTVSTGVLAAGGIRFTPDLPAPVKEAVHNLPLGLLTKIAFRAAGDDRLGIAPFHSARQSVGPHAPHPFGWIFWPYGHDHLFGFVGGSRAWDLAREGPRALEDAARQDLRAMFGTRADRLLGRCTLTEWGTDPLHLGSYSHARPGHHAARARLAEPLAGGRLLFAGEACHARYGATVAGAWLSGEAAARSAA